MTAYYLNLLMQAATYAVAVVGLTIVLGYTGQINLAQAAFFGLGAYSVALGTVSFGLPFWVALFAGIAIASIAGVVLGLTSFYATLAEHSFIACKSFVQALSLESKGLCVARHYSIIDGLNGLRPLRGRVEIWRGSLRAPFLFWSATARSSKWVEKEWRHRLTYRGLAHLSLLAGSATREAAPGLHRGQKVCAAKKLAFRTTHQFKLENPLPLFREGLASVIANIEIIPTAKLLNRPHEAGATRRA